MKKRAAGAKKPLAKGTELQQDAAQQIGDEYGNLVLDKRTKVQLRHELTLAHQAQASYRYELAAATKRFEQQKQEWQAQRSNRELEMKAKLTEGAAHMIEALARMIGGPGF